MVKSFSFFNATAAAKRFFTTRIIAPKKANTIANAKKMTLTSELNSKMIAATKLHQEIILKYRTFFAVNTSSRLMAASKRSNENKAVRAGRQKE
jgi:hypothetical protein